MTIEQTEARYSISTAKWWALGGAVVFCRKGLNAEDVMCAGHSGLGIRLIAVSLSPPRGVALLRSD